MWARGVPALLRGGEFPDLGAEEHARKRHLEVAVWAVGRRKCGSGETGLSSGSGGAMRAGFGPPSRLGSLWAARPAHGGTAAAGLPVPPTPSPAHGPFASACLPCAT